MVNKEKLNIALVTEELTQLGGAEKVLDALLELFPKAPVYTIVWDRERTNHRYDKFDIRPSFIQKMPFGVKKYKWYLTLMPRAVEKMDLSGYDIIFSITSALAKGVKTNKNQIHICYCNTPTRYLWTDREEYVKNAPIPFFIRPFMPKILNNLQKWDLKASSRPDYFIANSENVKKRIKKYYDRESDVIYPNVDVTRFQKASSNTKENYYILVSRLEPYKKVELVLDAFKNLKERLIVVGGGTKEKEMKDRASSNVTFLGRVPDEKLPELYAKARAFIFPQNEDFGITAVEAMAAGTPVIAYKEGGALETVVSGKTGEFFFPQTEEALAEKVINFNSKKYLKGNLIEQAEKFNKAIFKKKVLEYIVNRSKK